MRDQYLSLYEKTIQFVESIQEELLETAKLNQEDFTSIPKNNNEKEVHEEIADSIFALKEARKLTEAIVSELKKHISVYEQMLAANLSNKWIMEKDHLQSGTIRTPYTTTTVSVSLQLPIPNQAKDPEFYEAVGRFMGINEDALKRGVVYFKWEPLQEHFQELFEKGEPLPEGVSLDNFYLQRKITSRKGKKNMLGSN